MSILPIITHLLQPHEWKCQPTKFLTKENECHEFIMGSINMGIGGIASGIVTCYIINGGKNWKILTSEIKTSIFLEG